MKNNIVLWSFIALLLAVLTIFLVMRGSGMSWELVFEGLSQASPVWLVLAFLSMAGIIVFEGKALCVILEEVGYKRPLRSGILYSAADAYFSAITPSATGGQPGSAFFMIRDGISAPVSAAALLVNLVLYTVALAVWGIVCIAACPGLFELFNPGGKILIAAGYTILLVQVAVFLLALMKPALLSKIMRALIRLLHRLHLMRHPDRWIAKLEKMLQEYADCVKVISDRPRMLWKAFFWNMMQRFCQFCGVVFVYRALAGPWKNVMKLFSMQCLIYIGVYSVPIPGSMGATDLMMLDGYLSMMKRETAFRLQMLSRGVTFYCCVLASGVIVLTGYLITKNGRKRNTVTKEQKETSM